MFPLETSHWFMTDAPLEMPELLSGEASDRYTKGPDRRCLSDLSIFHVWFVCLLACIIYSCRKAASSTFPLVPCLLSQFAEMEPG